MTKISFEEKIKAATKLNKTGRPIANLAKAVKTNNAPEYNSDALRARSKATQFARGQRFNRVAQKLTASS